MRMNQEPTDPKADASADGGNLYAPPQAEIAEPAVAGYGDEFYVVAKRKFFLLYLITLGVYQWYWFYRHWALHRRYRDVALWPIPRAIFAIFFTHSLATRIEDRIKGNGSALAESLGGVAGGFVVFQIISNVIDRMSWKGIGSPMTDYLSLLMLVPLSLVLWQIQKAANLACGQPDGTANHRITGANVIWLVLGGLLWLLVIAGLLLPEAA